MLKKVQGKLADIKQQQVATVAKDLSSYCNFQTWIDSKLKIDALQSVTKQSSLEDDWAWLEQNTFELHGFYPHSALKYVCELFRQKWIYHNKVTEVGTTRFEEFIEFKHVSPLIVKIFDKLSMIVDKKKTDFASQEELLDQVERTLKLLCFLEIFAFNKINLVCVEQVQGIHTLMDLLKYYGNLEGNQHLLIEVEAKILKCVAICMRSDRVILQFLADAETNKHFFYVLDVAREQQAVLTGYGGDIMVAFMKHDVSILLNCFLVQRQLLMIEHPEVRKSTQLIQKFSDDTLGLVLQNLNNNREKKLSDFPKNVRLQMSNLILVCMFCSVWTSSDFTKSSSQQRIQDQLANMNYRKQNVPQTYAKIFLHLKELNRLEEDAQTFVEMSHKFIHDTVDRVEIPILMAPIEEGQQHHWSLSVQNEAVRDIETIHQKFEMWKSIMRDEQYFQQYQATYKICIEDSPPNELFTAPQTHDLRQVAADR